MTLATRIGYALQLQPLQAAMQPGTPVTGAAKINCQLIGIHAPWSLFVTQPTTNGRSVAVSEGQAFAVRMFDGGCARAFTARVMRCCTDPFPYLHLSYPTQFQEVVIRASRRVGANLTARVKNEAAGREKDCEGLVLDLSLSGAMVRAPLGLGEVGDALRVEITLELDGQPSQQLALPATLRRPYPVTAGDGSGFERYGLQFGALDPQSAIWVRAYVYERLVEEFEGGGSPADLAAAA